MKNKIIHFVESIDTKYNNGWSDCGKLIKTNQAYNETIKGRDIITCKKCLAHAKKYH